MGGAHVHVPRLQVADDDQTGVDPRPNLDGRSLGNGLTDH
jgi:hypothetical protein